ncbi:hypothetical protein EJ08DRAFT_308921 [Tothia fuscella]|uniref:Uncharacterized protein n=1 Tax=Tothia fuscella TaxID=1048955 RepID=A0A9P4TW81_9PEZI|nr:hypothetical protein EJ08DRAFT_308921 [Tothia fuscella]
MLPNSVLLLAFSAFAWCSASTPNSLDVFPKSIVDNCIQEADCGAPPGDDQPYGQYMDNMTLLLGWQLSAIYSTNPAITKLCGDDFFTLTSNWSRMDYPTVNVKNVLCPRIGCDIILDLPNIIKHKGRYLSNLFKIGIYFTTPNTWLGWSFMCSAIAPPRLQQLFGDDSTIDMACARMPHDRVPWDGDVGLIPDKEINLIHGNATELLAWQILSVFKSTKSLQNFCSTFDVYSVNMLKLNHDPDIIKGTVCNDGGAIRLPSLVEVKSATRTLYTNMYVDTLFNVGCCSYLDWICFGYEKGNLDHIILDDVNWMDKVVLKRNVIQKCEAGHV